MYDPDLSMPTPDGVAKSPQNFETRSERTYSDLSLLSISSRLALMLDGLTSGTD
jgi:hypothetical protein